MNEGPVSSSDGNLTSRVDSATAERLADVLRLTTLLSDQVLDAHIMKRPVPDEQVRALEGAALLLQEHAVPLPPLLMQVLHELEGASQNDTAEVEPSQLDQSKDYTGVVKSLARLFKPVRRS